MPSRKFKAQENNGGLKIPIGITVPMMTERKVKQQTNRK